MWSTTALVLVGRNAICCSFLRKYQVPRNQLSAWSSVFFLAFNCEFSFYHSKWSSVNAIFSTMLGIMRYMGDESLKRGQTLTDCVYELLMICHQYQPLRDEVYCQIIRQTTNNKSPRYVACWSLSLYPQFRHSLRKCDVNKWTASVACSSVYLLWRTTTTLSVGHFLLQSGLLIAGGQFSPSSLPQPYGRFWGCCRISCPFLCDALPCCSIHIYEKLQ